MSLPVLTDVRGLLSADDLAAIYKRADKCDDDERKRRGQLPRPTRCRECATILLLLTHIALISPAGPERQT